MGKYKYNPFTDTLDIAVGGVEVQDEGITIEGNATTLNFIGADVKASSAGGGVVNIYIPTPSYASHFNTTDGTTDATVDGPATTIRNVAGPTDEGNPYKIGDWTEGTKHDTIDNPNLYYATRESFLIDTTTDRLEVVVYDADGTTELRRFEITLDGDKTENDGVITITISNFAVNGDKYSAKAEVWIDLAQLIPDGGRFSVVITHYGEAAHIYEQRDVFYDANRNQASIGSIAVTEGTNKVIKYLSGVRYYTINSEFVIDIQNIDWLNDSSYPDNQVVVNANDYGIATFYLQGSQLTGWNSKWDNTGASYNGISKVNMTNKCIMKAGVVSAAPIDWTTGSSVSSTASNVLVDTYQANETRIFEDFRNENQRLKSDFTAWDGTQNLLTYDDGLGLQVKCSRLIYPQEDYTTYNPNQTEQPDYTTATGDRYYIRRIWHDNVSHSNGIFRLQDHNLTESDITNKNVEIWISLDGSEWYTLNDDYLGGVLTDGAGCRVNKDQYNLDTNNQIAFTLGEGKFTNETTGGGWGLYVKIIIKETAKNKYIGVFEEVTWV